MKDARHVTFNKAHYMCEHKPPYAKEIIATSKLAITSQELPNVPTTNINAQTQLSVQIAGTTDILPAIDTLPGTDVGKTATDAITINNTLPLTAEAPTPISVDSTPNHNNDAPSITTAPNRLSAKLPAPPLHIPTHVIPINDDGVVVWTLHRASDTPTETPTEFCISQHAHRPLVNITLSVKGLNLTLGLNLYKNPDNGKLTLRDMALSTPVAKVARWRSTLRESILTAVNSKKVITLLTATQECARLDPIQEPIVFTLMP